MKKLGIYIHIPFCKQKCFYCDFVSYANQDKYFQKYVQALNKEVNNFIDKMKTTEKLDNWSLLKTSLAQNLILGISIWFFRNYCNRNTNSIWNCII